MEHKISGMHGEVSDQDRASTSSSIQNPWYSRPLDVHRWSDHPEVKGMVEAMWATHFLDYLHPNQPRRGPAPKRPFHHQLRVIVLDLYVAWLEHPELSIGVSMSANAWNTGSRYNALHISKEILPIVHRLHKAGLIDFAAGSYSGVDGNGNRTTRIRASQVLQAVFGQAKLQRDDIGRVAAEECIILKASDDAGDNARPVEYDDTDETRRMRTELTAYNEVLANSFIDIPSLEVAEVGRLIKTGQDAGKTTRVPLDHHHHFVRRIFSRGDWGLNGRFYGGWWQQIGSKLRREILINDTPTVEVDFKGLHIAILSAEKGVAVQGDPYELGNGLVPHIPPDRQRGLVKHLILTALNAPTRTSAFQSFRDGWPTGDLAKKLTNSDLEVLLNAFTVKHPHLADRLGADQGIRLMNIDGRIAEIVHRHFTAQGVPVLSVHDSYIIDYTRVLELKAVMQRAAGEVLGVTLAVASTAMGLDEFRSDERDPGVVLDFVQWAQPVRSCGYLDRLAAWEGRKGLVVVPAV